jgi:hypothetical protein
LNGLERPSRGFEAGRGLGNALEGNAGTAESLLMALEGYLRFSDIG